MKRSMAMLSVAGLLLAVIAGAATAQTAPAGTLDADNLNHEPTLMGNISSYFANGQTFTVTRSGKLTGARLLLSKTNHPGDLTVEIAKVDAGSGLPAVPEDVVASAVKPASAFTSGSNDLGSLQPVDITFDTPVPVAAGEDLALILKAKGNTLASQEYTVGGTGDPFLGGGDTYQGGERIYQRCPFGAGEDWCGTPPSEWRRDVESDLIFGIYGTFPDTTPPEVSSTSPTNNATGVAATADISATFFEEGSGMDRATLNPGTFKVIRVKPTGSVPVAGTVSYDESSQAATFDPSSDLAKGLYRATITTGIKDNAGNALANRYSWTFATAGPR